MRHGDRHLSRPLARLIVLALLLSPSPVFAAFQVLSWNLRTSVSDSSGISTVQDIDRYQTVTNPWLFTSESQVGTNISRADYDYAWLTNGALGNFNTDVFQSVRSTKIDMAVEGQVDILPSEDVRVSIDTFINYAHTPGDDSWIATDFYIRNQTLGQFLYVESRDGGNGIFKPSSGTFSIAREDILTAGTTYRIHFGIRSNNIGDLPPTGMIDASGHMNFTITPVPEPATLILLLVALASLRPIRSSIPT